MRKIGVVLASAALAVAALFLGSYMGPASSMRKAKAQPAPAQPNIVFIPSEGSKRWS